MGKSRNTLTSQQIWNVTAFPPIDTWRPKGHASVKSSSNEEKRNQTAPAKLGLSLQKLHGMEQHLPFKHSERLWKEVWPWQEQDI